MLQLLGRWPESVRALTESIELCRTFGGAFGDVLGEQRLAQIETAIGHFEPAHARLQRALAQARASDSPMIRAHSLGRLYSTLALNRYEVGDFTEATRYLARGFGTQRVVGECAGCDVLLYPAAVPIYIAHGELDMAEHSCRKAEEAASAFRSRSWAATARYLLGLLAAAKGDSDLAATHFEEAASIFEHLGQPYDLACALEGLAQARLASNGSAMGEAESLMDKAALLYESLGSEFKADRAREKLVTR